MLPSLLCCCTIEAGSAGQDAQGDAHDNKRVEKERNGNIVLGKNRTKKQKEIEGKITAIKTKTKKGRVFERKITYELIILIKL